jgi:hypothetical protein
MIYQCFNSDLWLGSGLYVTEKPMSGNPSIISVPVDLLILNYRVAFSYIDQSMVILEFSESLASISGTLIQQWPFIYFSALCFCNSWFSGRIPTLLKDCASKLS